MAEQAWNLDVQVRRDGQELAAFDVRTGVERDDASVYTAAADQVRGLLISPESQFGTYLQHSFASGYGEARYAWRRGR